MVSLLYVRNSMSEIRALTDRQPPILVGQFDTLTSQPARGLVRMFPGGQHLDPDDRSVRSDIGDDVRRDADLPCYRACPQAHVQGIRLFVILTRIRLKAEQP
jgi:hypothetical protein